MAQQDGGSSRSEVPFRQHTFNQNRMTIESVIAVKKTTLKFSHLFNLAKSNSYLSPQTFPCCYSVRNLEMHLPQFTNEVYQNLLIEIASSSGQVANPDSPIEGPTKTDYYSLIKLWSRYNTILTHYHRHQLCKQELLIHIKIHSQTMYSSSEVPNHT